MKSIFFLYYSILCYVAATIQVMIINTEPVYLQGPFQSRHNGQDWLNLNIRVPV